jgi:hypothetical protein
MANPIFTFSADVAKELKPIWKYIANLSFETDLIFNNKEMSLVGIDASHIQIGTLKCPVDNAENTSCYLKFVDFYKLIEKLKEYSLEIESKEKKIIIRYQVGKRVRTLSLRFSTKPAEFEPIQLQIPTINDSFKIDYNFINEALQDAHFYSEIIEFNLNVKKQRFMMKAEGSLGDACYEIEADELIEHKIVSNILTYFSVNQMTPMKDIFSQPKLYLSDDRPLLIEETTKNNVFFQIALAQCTNEDDSAPASPLEK